ncbi:AcrR family transcriptional regulator [Duganella sp. 1411]|jgi:AcrR family transcriptional regulator|uniref:TetR/AcrR family transcriptional regulator n=1 Tax=Duganella sp. 1411 TaxID=2806572 RepID=UPI001AE16516|nr:TetR/AcrR family transcriptional regulator [Duganella sp. 1411]MBP1204063.1 AcrR family transcriptional regulator [Duganella sp. 1411]
MTTPAKRRTDPERAQNRRNQVLEAAAVCFARSGFHGASMSEISKQAGMSAGHIYNYFDSKDAIIMAIVERESEYVTGLLRDLQTRDDPLQAMIDDARRHIDESLDPQPWHVPLEMYAEASRNPVIAAQLRVHEESSRTQLRELVKQGRERRNLPVDDVMLDGRIDTIISYFQGLQIRALHRPEMNRDSLVDAFRIAMTALLLS